MTSTTNYQKQATDFLESHAITFSAVLIGSDCPAFCDDARKGIDMDKVDTFPRKSHIHGKHYRCTFKRPIGAAPQKELTIDFWNSYADEEFNAWRSGKVALERDYPYWDKFKRDRNSPRKLPTAYDVLSCIQKSDVGTFEDFCGDFGYDSDSRQAEQTYRAVVAEWKKVSQFFTEEELAEVQEIN